jgi:hypothetical protein
MIMVGWCFSPWLLIFGLTVGGSAGLVSGSPGSLVVGGWEARRSSQQRLSDTGEAGERGGEVVGPGPAGRDLDEGAAVAAYDLSCIAGPDLARSGGGVSR